MPPLDDTGAGRDAPAFELVGLRKRFGEKVAVDGAELAVPRGSFFGLVGPNGAGKTTSLSMGVGLLRPDEGTARVFGVDVWADPAGAKELVGVLADGLAMPERLTGREVLTYLGLLRGLEEATVGRRTDELLEVLELAGAGATLVIEYSTGMRKKIGLASAMLHAPGCWSSTSRSRAWTRCRRSRSGRSCSGSSPAAGPWSCPATSWRWLSRSATTSASSPAAGWFTAGPLEQVQAGVSLEQRFIDLVGVRAADVDGLAWLTS